MKNKKTLTLLLVVGTGMALTIAGCTGKYSKHDPARHSAWLMEEVNDELDLNTKQQAKLKVFVDELADGHKVMHSQRKQSRETIMSLLEQHSLDRKKSLALVQGHINTVQQRAPKLVNSFGDFYDSLNPEQRKEMREHLDKHFDHHHGRHGW
ncbi:MAG: Spy/CpxP family protein refolding chaperone [Gammaproteobacteria bacterium]|nr:Spy/CpxP family protein refolding chaperone [Gammaproteobacteria bacterium]